MVPTQRNRRQETQTPLSSPVQLPWLAHLPVAGAPSVVAPQAEVGTLHQQMQLPLSVVGVSVVVVVAVQVDAHRAATSHAAALKMSAP
jgi:hypothetical protein